MLDVRFFGVRGSTPCSSPDSRRYGGNTSCVALDAPGCPPIVFDLGTGLRYYGEALASRGEPFRGVALVTHLHWDHVQGLPFFQAINRTGASLLIVGPPESNTSLFDAFSSFMKPPYFPIRICDLAGDIAFRDACFEEFAVGAASVTVRPVPHVGSTNGYRVDVHGVSVSYVSDHQQPLHDPTHVDRHVLDLCHGADVLIHDAQYTPAEFAERKHWGHCTIEYALEVARQARVKTLVLFHHDPLHHDDLLDGVDAEAAAWGRAHGIEVLTAREGMHLRVEAAQPTRAASTAIARGQGLTSPL